ncbi:hypothetical protein QRE63_01530 [Bacillus mycoides]|uniref:hypothetical protein n=1 Tax=Bacillus mycoides TaxID=1405 RepID=UPI00256FDECD|nr:hypothetical protein [Bacillus mycoides]WJE64687.1 hypothetical protein QRE63_01530 [Bacillus mycoides]
MSNSKEFCPYCHAALQRKPIPKQSQKVYGTTHFTIKIGITSIETDKILKWKYPDCNKAWRKD